MRGNAASAQNQWAPVRAGFDGELSLSADAEACSGPLLSHHRGEPPHHTVDGSTRWEATRYLDSECGLAVRCELWPGSPGHWTTCASFRSPQCSNVGVLSRDTHRQLLASLLAAAAQHRPAPSRFHACPKTVFVLATPVPWSVCRFHAFPYFEPCNLAGPGILGQG